MRAPLLAAVLAATATLAPAAAEAQAARPAAAATSTWEIDPVHSEMSFRVRHLLSRVNGTFTDWSGTITLDEANPARSSVRVAIRTASIDTNNERRDGHLRSPDFFAADSFPTITFASRRVTQRGNDLRIEGDLTIRGVTRPVVLTGTASGRRRGMQGEERIFYTASTTIDRTAFGVSWNRAAEGGGAVLGDEVQITLDIQAVRAQPTAAR